jgi:hypothetical protein
VISSHYSYDQANRLTKLVHSASTTPPASGWGTTPNPLAGYQCTYDLAHRIASIDSYIDGLTSFTYDTTNQIASSDHTGQADKAYDYDLNGNRDTGYTTGPNNRVLSDGTYDYEYDDEGNMTAKETISTGERVEYSWDHRNRLVTTTFKNSGGTVIKTVDQTYDVFNRWIKRSIDPDGATGSATLQDTIFVYDGNQAPCARIGSAVKNHDAGTGFCLSSGRIADRVCDGNRPS